MAELRVNVQERRRAHYNTSIVIFPDSAVTAGYRKLFPYAKALLSAITVPVPKPSLHEPNRAYSHRQDKHLAEDMEWYQQNINLARL
jgi:predicted amidohydrolase